MFKKIKQFFKVTGTNYRFSSEVDRYLANSASLEDLESRQKMIARGEAPFQRHSQMISKGWIQ
jgi:hypothetical protein